MIMLSTAAEIPYRAPGPPQTRAVQRRSAVAAARGLAGGCGRLVTTASAATAVQPVPPGTRGAPRSPR